MLLAAALWFASNKCQAFVRSCAEFVHEGCLGQGCLIWVEHVSSLLRYEHGAGHLSC
jgi:hypothetical protein